MNAVAKKEGSNITIYIIVGLAGILGSLARYYVGLGVSNLTHHTFLFGTLLVNLSGCFVLAWLMAYVAEMNLMRPEIVTGIGTGFIGAFTTFSHFSVETARLIILGHKDLEIAILYVAITMLGGLVASGLGYFYGKTLTKKRTDRGS